MFYTLERTVLFCHAVIIHAVSDCWFIATSSWSFLLFFFTRRTPSPPKNTSSPSSYVSLFLAKPEPLATSSPLSTAVTTADLACTGQETWRAESFLQVTWGFVVCDLFGPHSCWMQACWLFVVCDKWHIAPGCWKIGVTIVIGCFLMSFSVSSRLVLCLLPRSLLRLLNRISSQSRHCWICWCQPAVSKDWRQYYDFMWLLVTWTCLFTSKKR